MPLSHRTHPNGVHHLAISTGDIKTQIAFFTDVLGAELKALYWMHNAARVWHGFLKLSDSCYLAFAQGPEFHKIARIEGVTHAPQASAESSPGTMTHLALNVTDEAELLAMRDRIRSRGIICIGPVDHGLCKSIYFAGPEGLNLEIATSEGNGIDARQWIDPEVVSLAGISPEELARYVRPAAFEDRGGGVPQPSYDPTKPLQKWAPERLERALAGDDVAVSMAEPPVKLEPGKLEPVRG